MTQTISTIQLNVSLDEKKIPQQIHWKAQSIDAMQEARAFFLSLWDANSKETYKIDLWTTNMQKDEMLRFFQETILSMSDTLESSTACSETAKELREFGKIFYNKAVNELATKK